MMLQKRLSAKCIWAWDLSDFYQNCLKGIGDVEWTWTFYQQNWLSTMIFGLLLTKNKGYACTPPTWCHALHLFHPHPWQSHIWPETIMSCSVEFYYSSISIFFFTDVLWNPITLIIFFQWQISLYLTIVHEHAKVE